MPEQLVTFRICDDVYALPIKEVDSIERVGSIRRVPLATGPIIGVMNLRGQVITVADLRAVLLHAQNPPTEEARLLIVESVAYLVDAALDIIESDHAIHMQVDPGPAVGAILHQAGTVIAVLRKECLLTHGSVNRARD